jgi:calcineurin-like phosphoesterase family protein
MMRDIWLISDTHFGHENILKFTDSNTGKLVRGDLFNSVDQMDEYMIDQWNRYVKPGDIVYHLGDVFFGDKDKFLKNFKKLHGAKRLIVGNHDDIKWIAKHELFQKIMMWRMFPEHGLLLTHVPVHDTIMYEGRFRNFPGTPLNVHGHIHQNPSPTENHKCVCVEQIDFTPIHIEDVRDGRKTRG